MPEKHAHWERVSCYRKDICENDQIVRTEMVGLFRCSECLQQEIFREETKPITETCPHCQSIMDETEKEKER